jgi:hypothetical protein
MSKTPQELLAPIAEARARLMAKCASYNIIIEDDHQGMAKCEQSYSQDLMFDPEKQEWNIIHLASLSLLKSVLLGNIKRIYIPLNWFEYDSLNQCFVSTFYATFDGTESTAFFILYRRSLKERGIENIATCDLETIESVCCAIKEAAKKSTLPVHGEFDRLKLSFPCLDFSDPSGLPPQGPVFQQMQRIPFAGRVSVSDQGTLYLSHISIEESPDA